MNLLATFYVRGWTLINALGSYVLWSDAYGLGAHRGLPDHPFLPSSLPPRPLACVWIFDGFIELGFLIKASEAQVVQIHIYIYMCVCVKQRSPRLLRSS